MNKKEVLNASMDLILSKNTELRNKMIELGKLEAEKEKIKREIEVIEARIELEIAREVDPATGKKKYSNETERRAAKKIRLSEDTQYLTKIDLLAQVEQKLVELNADIRYLQNLIQAYTYAIKYLSE